MSLRNYQIRLIMIGVGLALGISACGFLRSPSSFDSILGGDFESNGERIYFTATTERGTRVRSRGGPSFGGMMGRLTCASCHGSDGRGGIHWMHMQPMDAPDIRWSTLSSAEHGNHGDHDETDDYLAYDDSSFKKAVLEGIAPNGHNLSSSMPRWEMSDADLEDLISFLMTLP